MPAPPKQANRFYCSTKTATVGTNCSSAADWTRCNAPKTAVGQPLKYYHLLPSVRGDFLFKLGRLAQAKQEFERAAALTQNERERDLLLSRAAACDTSASLSA